MTDRLLIGQLTQGIRGPMTGARADRAWQGANGQEGVSFRELLQRQQLKISHHAEQRLRQRGISLEPEQLERIAGAMDQAAAKGAKDSLVLYGGMALIVNVPNRTVVTAMDGPSMKDHIFTQIDSAVVIS